MTSKERAALRAQANPLEPIFQIGKDGVSDNMISQIDDALDARELLKIRVHLETAPQSPREFADELAKPLEAEVIQVIGGVIVLYRKADKEKIKAKKAAAAAAAGKKAARILPPQRQGLICFRSLLRISATQLFPISNLKGRVKATLITPLIKSPPFIRVQGCF